MRQERLDKKKTDNKEAGRQRLENGRKRGGKGDRIWVRQINRQPVKKKE